VSTIQKLGRLADAARTSAQLAADDRESRDRAIEDADLEHLSVREIARATRLDPTHVSRILTRRIAERQAQA
jgi:hypothetical protein